MRRCCELATMFSIVPTSDRLCQNLRLWPMAYAIGLSSSHGLPIQFQSSGVNEHADITYLPRMDAALRRVRCASLHVTRIKEFVPFIGHVLKDSLKIV